MSMIWESMVDRLEHCTDLAMLRCKKRVRSGQTVFLQGCYVEMWVTLETEGLSLQEGCSERLAVLQEKHFAMHQVVRICTGWDQCNLECQVAR